jgi:hypothetical protein
MQTARRLYMYLMSGITLGVLLVGLNALLTVVLHAIGLGRGEFAGGEQGDREQLALAAALIVVGLVVWTIHWLLVERSLRAENPAHDQERGSGVRALYLTVVLAVLLVFGVLAGIQLLQELVRALLGVDSSGEFGFGGSDVGATTATLLVTALAWTYHAAIRRRDLEAGPLAGAPAWIPRVYLYGAALVGLILTALSIGTLLGTGLEAIVEGAPAFGDEDFRRRAVADAVAGTLGWGLVWLGHWWYATSLLRDTRWRGLSERRAKLRLAFFVAAIAASAVAITTFGTQMLAAAIAFALGTGDLAEDVQPALAIGVPLLSALPWAVAWWLHWRWMRAESMEADGPDWIATVDRLDAAALSLIGVGATAAGVGGLLGLLFDVLLGGNRTDGDFWRIELSQYVAVGLIGLVLWLWNWSRLQTRHAGDPLVEAGSTVRRAYLLIVVALALISTLGSLAYLLFRLFNAILQVNQFDNQASALSTPLGVVLVAATIALYHGLALRRDQSLRAEAASAEAEAAGNVPPTVIAAPARRTLILNGPPDADLDAAVAAMRAGLAPGLRLEDAPASD